MPRILMVEDNDPFARMLEKTLILLGHEVTRALDGKQGLRCYDPAKFDLVLTDLVMPDMDGTEMIMKLKKNNPTVKIIAMSGGGRNNSEVYLPVAKHLGADQILAKPFKPAQLSAAIDTVLGLSAQKPPQQNQNEP